jgi:hypothetical protein
MHTKFHEDCFGCSGNIKVITSKISEVVVSVLPMKRFLNCPVDVTSGGMIYILSLMTIGSGIRIILSVLR